jgi:hypothetical protein
MPRELAASNVVIVAQRFNPSVVSQLWLVRHGLLTEADLASGTGYLFTEVIVQVQTGQFALLVTPDQFQLIPKVPEIEQQTLIEDKVGTIVRMLPHTPFRAVGLNFTWYVTPIDGNIAQMSRELFFQRDRPLFHEFAEPDARFGGYLSKDVLDFRLKLDIKPVIVPLEGRSEERLQLLFNYHAEIPEAEGAVEMIRGLLRRWDEAAELARRMVDIVDDGEHR